MTKNSAIYVFFLLHTLFNLGWAIVLFSVFREQWNNVAAVIHGIFTGIFTQILHHFLLCTRD